MNQEQKKITVKQYLNKRAKIRRYSGEEFYPLYIQIIVNGKKAQIKSRINEHLKIYRSDIERLTQNDQKLNNLIAEGFFSDSLLERIIKEQYFPIHHLLIDEIAVLTRIIKIQKPFDNENFTLVDFGNEYEKYTAEITKLLDDKIKSLFIDELKAIFLRSIDEEEKRDIFKITNYLIHFINWNNTFVTFYESTFEIIPSELKTIESLINKELRTTIKAFMAYYTHVNMLQRFFEKRELGKISTLSYLDWQTDIKDYVLHQFEGIFGEQKALEYILALDNILNLVIRR